MPRSRSTDMPQRPSPRGLANLRTSISNSDPTHHRSRPERSPKLARGPQVEQKKLGTRIADLESQLGQAQDELKSLKNQLSSAEAAKKAAQEQLQIKKSSKKQQQKVDECKAPDHGVQQETDVFEVPVKKVTHVEQHKSFDELACKNDEISCLKTKLEEKGKEVDVLRNENKKLKNQLNENLQKLLSAECEIEGLSLRLKTADQELEKSKASEVQISQKLEAAEKAKVELENEMKRLCVQTEQWRKAADAAAAILADDGVSSRCRAMDEHYGDAFDSVGSYDGLMDGGDDDVFEGGKKKGSGIRMFGDLWKKKGNK